MLRWSSLVFVLALVVTACGAGNQPSSVTWRNVTLQVPDGWYVFEEEDTRLSISNRDIGPAAVRGVEEGEDVDPPEDAVAMFFTFEPRTLPQDWREYAEQQDATVESDDQIQVGGEVPATRMVMNYVTDGIPLREMVVVIPSRNIVVLSQPVPVFRQQDGPEIFLDHVETFIEVLETAEFGAPVLE